LNKNTHGCISIVTELRSTLEQLQLQTCSRFSFRWLGCNHTKLGLIFLIDLGALLDWATFSLKFT